MESEGGFAKDGKGFKEKLKKHLMTGAEWYFSTSPIGDDYFLKYGADSDKFVKYPFTSLYEKDIRKDIVSDEEKEEIREELKVTEKKVIVVVGRFIYVKGFDVLLEALKSVDKSIGVYFVGGIPTDEYIKKVEECHLSSVHFIGFKSKEELKKYYDCADLFVLPTREDIWGLVINEAMARGLPVITTERCIAGVELVKNDENGYIVPVDDAVSLSEKIVAVFENEERRKSFGRKAIEKIQWYTFESMAKVHMDFFKNN